MEGEQSGRWQRKGRAFAWEDGKDCENVWLQLGLGGSALLESDVADVQTPKTFS